LDVCEAKQKNPMTTTDGALSVIASMYVKGLSINSQAKNEQISRKK
jgi:hypothetical protein